LIGHIAYDFISVFHCNYDSVMRVMETIISEHRVGFGLNSESEQKMGRWVMGQMGHENGMGHIGHGSLCADP